MAKPTPIDEGRRLLSEMNAAEALAAVDAVSGATDALLIRARASVALERFDDGYQAIGVVSSRRDLTERQQAELRIVRARLLRCSSSSHDDALDAAMRGANLAERLGAMDLAAEGHLEAARVLARKRARELADERLRKAHTARPNDAFVLASEGDVLVAFDDRPAAQQRYQAARATGPLGERLGRAGAANVAFLLGQFDAAYAELAALAPLRSGEGHLRRLRARLLLSQQRWAEAVYAFDEVLARGVGSERAIGDRYERASALYRAGWFPHARTAYEALGALPDRNRDVELARRHARLLARPDVTQRRWARLTAFPTVAQLRSHCGPAACELYLRYFGIPASQIEVARAIKEPNAGTPLYRMRAFLENAGFHTRRIEAQLPMLKRLVDVQIPVIMEEDYVASGHVAVAIGYDDVRELLEVQDPMSHEVRETCYEDLAELRELSNHGALVAVPRNDAARIATLDRIGAVECRYISLVDEAWAALDTGKPEDGDRLVEQSQALHRDYEMAWFFKFQRAMGKFDKNPTAESRLAMHRVVAEVRAIWPDEDWPEQLHGEALVSDARYAEALTAFRKARDREPRDPRTWSSMGMCEMALGKDDDAFESLSQALRRDPSNASANARLAWLTLERGDLDRASTLNAVARRLGPKVPMNHWVHGRILAKRDQHEKAVEAFDRAISLDARKGSTFLDRAASMAKLGRIDDAAASLLQVAEKLSNSRYLRVERARLLFEYGRPKEASHAAQELLVEDPRDGVSLAILGASLLAQDLIDEGGKQLRAAMRLRPTDPWAYVELGRHLRRTKEPARAVEAFATALGLAGSDPRRELELGFALAEAGHVQDATRYLSRAGSRANLGEDELVRVGEILVDAGKAAKPFFDDVLATRAEDPAAMRAFVRIMLELCWAPSAADPVLARLARVAPQDPYALAYRGAQSMDRSLDGEAKGEELLRQAVTAAPTREYPRRALADRLALRGRHEDALELLAPCELRHQVVRTRVRALLGLGREADADAEIARFDARWSRGGKASYGGRSLGYDALLARGRYAEALQRSEELAKEDGERDDDGRLDPWETSKFECLARMGEDERALRFGERQALDGPSLARLTLLAHEAGRPLLAQALADRALGLAADHMAALYVSARSHELRRDEVAALKILRDLARRDADWHRPHAAIARSCLATADPLAGAAADMAVRAGPTFAETFSVRAQVRLVGGDRHGALVDAERAYRMARPDQRMREHLDLAGMRAQLLGDRAAAEDLYARYLAGPVSAADHRRVQRLRACG